MAGQLDKLLKDVAKKIVADLGESLDTSIVYTRKTSPVYNTSTYSHQNLTNKVNK